MQVQRHGVQICAPMASMPKPTCMNRSLKAQLKYADKIGARYTMVIGDSELEAGKARLKDMDTGEEQEVAFDRLADAPARRQQEASRLYGEIAHAQFGLEEISGVLGQE